MPSYVHLYPVGFPSSISTLQLPMFARTSVRKWVVLSTQTGSTAPALLLPLPLITVLLETLGIHRLSIDQ